MSLTSALNPVGLSFGAPFQRDKHHPAITEVPFHHDPNYLQLQRMLTRYQNLILLTDSNNTPDAIPAYDLTPLQRRIRAELYCPLPYHRTKWLHSIESARNLLLSLERQAQNIKTPRAKKEALKDLATKRQIIKRLRNRVEEIGREVDSLGEKAWQNRDQEEENLLGERVGDVLAKLGHNIDTTDKKSQPDRDLPGGKPVTNVLEDANQGLGDEQQDRNTLFDSTLRKRGQNKDPSDGPSSTDKGTTSGFSNLAETEKSLHNHTREHEDLTSALVSMAAQLKQQSRAFQFSLSQDDSLLNRAVEGLDLNLTSMNAASRNMAFLRRMSEEQGWLGRLKLYAIIFGLWVAAVLLVFVGPKLRF